MGAAVELLPYAMGQSGHSQLPNPKGDLAAAMWLPGKDQMGRQRSPQMSGCPDDIRGRCPHPPPAPGHFKGLPTPAWMAGWHISTTLPKWGLKLKLKLNVPYEHH